MNRAGVQLTAVLAFTFLSFLFSPAYTVHLRHRFAQALPDEWAKVTNNGSFAYVSPLIVSTRNHEEGVYAAKLRQIALHGFPYDPHTGDRSPRSWIFDCMLFYPLSPFLLLTHGNVQIAWILAHAAFGTLWVLLLYALFLVYVQDSRLSLLFAVGAFFFFDVWLWAGFDVLPALLTPRRLPEMLFLLVSRMCGPIHFMRLPTPCMTYLWLYASLGLCLRLALSASRRLGPALLTGLSLGMLCLAHFYEWTFGVGSLLLFFAVTRQQGLPAPGRWNLGAASAVAVGLSSAYYILARHLTRDVMADVIARMGVFGVHADWKSLLYLLLAALFWRRFLQLEGQKRWFWALAGVNELAAFFISNLSVVLRYDLQFGHASLLAAVSAVLMGFCWALDSVRIRGALRPHAWILIGAICAWVLLREKSWAETHYRLFGTPRDVDTATEWINRNVPPGSLWTSLSGALIEFLPLKIDMRYPVSNGVPAFGSPVKTDAILSGLGQTLKTLDVDTERFLEQRWRHCWEQDQRKQWITYLTRDLAWEQTQRAAWTYFALALKAYPPLYSREEEHRIVRFSRDLPLLDRPFYFWLQRGDESFLRRNPERLGGALIYQNPSVRLYLFPVVDPAAETHERRTQKSKT